MDWPTEVVEAPVPGLDPRVRRFRLGDEVDVYVLVTDRLLVVVDTLSTPADARQLRAAIEPLLDGRRLVVVNTHADWDHAWGNQVFADALVVASRACAERLAGADFTAAMTQMRAEMPGRFDEVVATVPDLAVDGTFALDGDAAEWPWPHGPDGPGLVEARASLVRLQGLAPAVVLPCHGGEHGPELLAANIAYLDAVVADPEMTLEAAAAMAGTTAAALPELYVAFHRDARAAAATLR
jgi:glyoxylase-like metal-dependent hydrolase (beta-lactamase superfamily II)